MTARPVPISGEPDEPRLDEILGQIHDRLTRIEERLGGVDERLDRIEKRMVTKDDLAVVTREMRGGFSDINKSLAAIHAKLDDGTGR